MQLIQTNDGKPAPEEGRTAAEDIYEMLILLGASQDQAKRKVAELFSPPRVTRALSSLPRLIGLAPGSTFDLRVDKDGVSWDFTRAADRTEARRRIATEKPYMVIGSPPCTDYCPLNERLNFLKMSTAEVSKRKA